MVNLRAVILNSQRKSRFFIFHNEFFIIDKEKVGLDWTIATSYEVAKWGGQVLITNPTLTLTLTPT